MRNFLPREILSFLKISFLVNKIGKTILRTYMGWPIHKIEAHHATSGMYFFISYQKFNNTIDI